MQTIAYASPWVPPEWIAAHAMRPSWLRLGRKGGTAVSSVGGTPLSGVGGTALGAAKGVSGGPTPLADRDVSPHPLVGVRRGVCPFAGALADAAIAGLDASALVMTTACDQMRYAAAVVQQRSRLPMFLLNVPSTWQTPTARQLYRDELERLGHWLKRLGGRAPSRDDLAGVMLRYDFARALLCTSRAQLSGRQFAEALAAVRGMPAGSNGPGVFFGSSGATARTPPDPGEYNASSLSGCADGVESPGVTSPKCGCEKPPDREEALYSPAVSKNDQDAIDGADSPPPGVPLAILGGPLLADDLALLDVIEQSGGRVVLDATEGGERTLPAALDRSRIPADPLGELVRAYFDGIPDVFHRPNDRLYRWLAEQAAARRFRGIVLRRYVWCDLWHAELSRLKERSPVPVLALDAADGDSGTASRTRGRIEAFLEMLR